MRATKPASPRICSIHIHFVSYSLLLLMLGLAESSLCAQTIRIKLVDGRNGHPMAGTCVNVWVGHDRKEATAIPTNGNGVAMLWLTEEPSEVDTSHKWSGCGLFGVINPVLKYEDDIRVNVGYVLCRSGRGKDSWLAMKEYSTRHILHAGFVSPNTCGTATVESKPGELTIFVRPLSWLEKLKQ
jgi:hypothetical protein